MSSYRYIFLGILVLIINFCFYPSLALITRYHLSAPMTDGACPQSNCVIGINGIITCWGYNGYDTNDAPTSISFITVSVGYKHSCGVRADNQYVECWGASNTYLEQNPPSRAYEKVVVAGTHSCAIRTGSGYIDCWGDNTDGKATPPYPSTAYKQISSYWKGTCAIRTTGGYIDCWGNNDYLLVSNVPTAMSFIDIDCGYYHCCALRADNNRAVCWGPNTEGESTPPATTAFLQIGSGLRYSCGLRLDNGLVNCWGVNDKGQQNVSTTTSYVSLFSGYWHGCGIRSSDGIIECWGNDWFGKLNVPNSGDLLLHGDSCGVGSGCLSCSFNGGYCYGCLPDYKWNQLTGECTYIKCTEYCSDAFGLSCYPFTMTYNCDDCSTTSNICNSCISGYRKDVNGQCNVMTSASNELINNYHLSAPINDGPCPQNNCVIGINGIVSCWGYPYYGVIDAPTSISFITVSLGYKHSCGVRADNQNVECWGDDNIYGQQNPPSSTSYIKVVVGGTHSCAIRTGSGYIDCWGDNTDGKATPPYFSTAYKQISSYWDGTCAIRTSNGYIDCWGKDTSLTVSNAPTGISFIDIDCGYYHCCALRADNNRAVCWGPNTEGESTPPAVTPFLQIGSGLRYSCGLRLDNGIVNCWGINDKGQQNVSTTTSYVSLFSGYWHGCGIRSSDGIIECWGNDWFGKLNVPNSGDLFLHGDSCGVGSGCLSCSFNGGYCYGCLPGYAWNHLTGECTSCVECISFSSGGTNSSCSSFTQNSCSTCSIADNKCLSCQAGYGYNSVTGTCAEECESCVTYNTEGSTTSCLAFTKATDCSNCSVTSDYCYECNNLVNNEGTCIQCVECESYANGDACLQFTKAYGCSDCSITSNNCLSCHPGYGMNLGECSECEACSTYSPGGRGLCTEFSKDQYCADCSIFTDACNGCSPGYGLNESTEICTSCEDVIGYSPGISLDCISCATCMTCDSITGGCISCTNEGEFLSDLPGLKYTVCVASCGDNMVKYKPSEEEHSMCLNSCPGALVPDGNDVCIVATAQTDLLMYTLTAMLLGFILFLILVCLIGRIRKIRNQQPMLAIAAIIAIYDFATDVLLLYSIRTYEAVRLHFLVGCGILVFSVLVNAFLLFRMMLRSMKFNTAFRHWLNKRIYAFGFLACIACTNLNIASIFTSHLFGMEVFSAPLDDMEMHLKGLGLVSQLLEDVPQLLVQLSIAQTLYSLSIESIGDWHAMLILSVATTIVSLAVGIFSRGLFLAIYMCGGGEQNKSSIPVGKKFTATATPGNTGTTPGMSTPGMSTPGMHRSTYSAMSPPTGDGRTYEMPIFVPENNRHALVYDTGGQLPLQPTPIEPHHLNNNSQVLQTTQQYQTPLSPPPPSQSQRFSQPMQTSQQYNQIAMQQQYQRAMQQNVMRMQQTPMQPQQMPMQQMQPQQMQPQQTPMQQQMPMQQDNENNAK